MTGGVSGRRENAIGTASDPDDERKASTLGAVELAAKPRGDGMPAGNARRISARSAVGLAFLRTAGTGWLGRYCIVTPCKRINPSGTCWKPVMPRFMPTMFLPVHR